MQKYTLRWKGDLTATLVRVMSAQKAIHAGVFECVSRKAGHLVGSQLGIEEVKAPHRVKGVAAWVKSR